MLPLSGRALYSQYRHLLTLSATSVASNSSFGPVRRGVSSKPKNDDVPPPNQDRKPGEKKSSENSNNTSNAIDKHLFRKHLEQLRELRASSHVIETTKEDSRPAWYRWIVESVLGPLFQQGVSDVIAGQLEQEFDVEEFLEGAKDAFWIGVMSLSSIKQSIAVHKLLGEGDYAALKPMLSAKLLSALETTGEEYRTAGLLYRTELDPELHPIQAQVRSLSIWTREDVEKYDAERAELAPEESAREGTQGVFATSTPRYPAGRFLVLTVRVQTEQNVIVTRAEDGAVVAHIKDRRPSLWKFARLLPRDIPTRRLEDPWWLLTFA